MFAAVSDYRNMYICCKCKWQIEHSFFYCMKQYFVAGCATWLNHAKTSSGPNFLKHRSINHFMLCAVMTNKLKEAVSSVSSQNSSSRYWILQNPRFHFIPWQLTQCMDLRRGKKSWKGSANTGSVGCTFPLIYSFMF